MDHPASPSASPTSELPLQRVAEWVYCPRLFYLRQVEGHDLANEHVLRGRLSHERVDRPGAARARRAPPCAEDRAPAEWRELRAVPLGSSALGVSAQLDSVLLRDGLAIPVERKSGSGPDPDAATWVKGVWDADAVQVALQALLLREAGREVPHGEVYYAASQHMRQVPLSEELLARARDAVVAARAAAVAPQRPPPLEESPKCRGCALAEVCLPDESAVLRRGEPPLTPLRPWAGRPEGLSVVVTTAGTVVRKETEALLIQPREGAPRRVPLDGLAELALYGSVAASTAALAACLERGVPVAFHSASGRLLGVVSAGLASNVQLRIAQHEAARDEAAALRLAREFVRGKLRNQRTLLRRNSDLSEDQRAQLAGLLRAIDDAPDRAALMGIEGRFARVYFDGFAALLRTRTDVEMVGRSRRPPADPVNALLSFGYAVLTRACAQVVTRVGFDPMRGFLHVPGWGRPALALDLVEELRALVVDSVVLRVLAERRLTAADFHCELGAVTLTPAARRVYLQALDARLEEEVQHPLFGYRVSYRRALELQARLLARVLVGEAERYVALTTR